MIKLMNNQNMWESPVSAHPIKTGTDSVLYTYNHTLGVVPDLTKLFVDYNGNGNWTEMWDLDCGGPSAAYWRGWYVETVSSSSISVRLYSIGNEVLNIKFRCFVLGTTQTITNLTPAFQWSTNEQVYPFEKDNSGNTLYCKYYELGAMPNSGWKAIAHSIPSWSADKIFSLKTLIKSANHGGIAVTVPLPLHDGGTITNEHIGGNNINIYASNNYYSSNGYNAYMYLIYSK